MAESGQADIPTTPQNANCPGTVTENSCARKCALETDFNRNKRKTQRRGNAHYQSMRPQIYLAGPSHCFLSDFVLRSANRWTENCK